MEILSIIPARGGSKGIKRKNLKPILNKPLVAYTIEASLNSKYITKTIVSSEDDEILEVSKKYGAEIFYSDIVFYPSTTLSCEIYCLKCARSAISTLLSAFTSAAFSLVSTSTLSPRK